jgi:hypothetical protein
MTGQHRLEGKMITPPPALVNLIHDLLFELLGKNPAATSSEKYVQHHIEFGIAEAVVTPATFSGSGSTTTARKFSTSG